MENTADPIHILKEKNTFLKKENHLLREQIRYLKMKTFGRSKDDLPGDEEQLSLFPEEDRTAEPESEPIQVTYTRRKGGRKGLDPSLPREEVILEISEEQRRCGCGSEKACIGAETSEKLEYVPAVLKVIKTIRPKYACPHCEGIEDDGPTVVIAPAQPALIPRSIVTPSLMAYILVSKITDALPFYRQEKQFKRLGVHLSRGSMANWTIQIAKKCQKIVDLLIKESQKRTAIQLDETTVQVMNEKNRKNTTKSYMWLLRAGPPKIGPLKNRLPFPDEPEIVVYWYQPSRSADIARSIVADFRGFIQTDEYRGYDFLDKKEAALQGWVHVLCMAHLRRGFVDAEKVNQNSNMKASSGPASDCVKSIKAIYQKDAEVRAAVTTRDELLVELRDGVLPLLEEFHQKVTNLDGRVTPKSKLGKAISYAVRTLPKIMKYVDCPNLTLDNNDTENKVRPFAVGRKNWLMANTPDGAHALATWFTLVETAKANGWEPHQYLLHLLEGIKDGAGLVTLMPTLPPPTCV